MSRFDRRGDGSAFLPAGVLVLGAAVALADEFHQATMLIRTGSPGDALLDLVGVAWGLWLAGRRR